MKFYCGPSKEEKARKAYQRYLEWVEYLKNWHDKFLWWPRRMEDGYCHWLETVERRVFDVLADSEYTYEPLWKTEWRLK